MAGTGTRLTLPGPATCLVTVPLDHGLPRRAGRYPAVIKLWSDAWAEMVPFLSFDVEIGK